MASVAASPFLVDSTTLHEMTADVDHGVKMLDALGGVKGLAEKLKTNLTTGLDVPASFSPFLPPPQNGQRSEVATEHARTGRASGHGGGGGDVEGQRRDPVSSLLRDRVTAFGVNALPEEAETTFWDFVKESLEDHMLQILIVSAVVSLCLGLLVPSQETGQVDYAHGWVDGAAILLSVCLVTGVSSVNNYQKDQKFKELSAKRPAKMVSVLRNGGAQERILDSELLVGDILLVSSGDVLSVDGVVLQATQLKMDESAATGENDDIAKVAYDDVGNDESSSNNSGGDGDERVQDKGENDKTSDTRAVKGGDMSQGDCLVRSGTNVVEGEGMVLVTSVGVNSFSGKIAMEVRKDTEETPLQEKLTVLADQMGYLGMAAAFLMFTILSAKETYDTAVARKHSFYYKKYLDNLITAVTIVVVAVPEGLPLSVTIALAYSMKQMFKENNLVRHLAACETMGGATTICSDKTGTITQNEMTVTDGFTGDGVHFIVPLLTATSTSTSTSPTTERDAGLPSHAANLSPTTAEAHRADTAARVFTDVFAAPTPPPPKEEEGSTAVSPATTATTMRSLFLEGIAMNTKCERLVGESNEKTVKRGRGNGSGKLTGSKTEQALIGFAERLGEDPFAIRAELFARISDVAHVRAHHHHHNHNPRSSSANSSSNHNSNGDDNANGEAALLQKEMRVYPFTSARKRMTTAFVLRGSADRKESGIVRYHVKGASELLLQRCESYIDSEGRTRPIDKAARERLESSILSLARRRLRTLALAYAETDLSSSSSIIAMGGPTEEQEENPSATGRAGKVRSRLVLSADAKNSSSSDGGSRQRPDIAAFAFPEDDTQLPALTFIGLVGIRDPVRPEVPAAIERCRRAGVTVRMITGDNKATAVAIAREVGIYGPVWFSDRPRYRGGEPGSGVVAGEQGLVLEGRQFREMAKSERKLNAILPKLQVISRASPLDKQILVAALMKRGEVVAVTGDGTNDAPALKNASVGFSMNGGTDVAKTASDVVILDDNFATIVTAMKWGRNVHDNIAKFLQFQMTVNVAAVVVSFVGSLTDAAGEAPLKPVQLLWVNLIMDTLAALALATESPAESVLERQPRSKNAPLITRRMWANILGQSLYQIALQLWLLSHGHSFLGVPFHSEQHLSAVFNVFVLLQLFNEFNARILDTTLFVLTGIHRAPLFLLVVGACFVVQICGIQYSGSLMRAAPLSGDVWRKCVLLSVVPLPLGLLLRMIPVGEKAVPAPHIVVDLAEEQALWEGRQERRRPTLKAVAKKVIMQLRIVRVLQEAKRRKKREGGGQHRVASVTPLVAD